MRFRLSSKGLYFEKQYKMHQIQRKWKKPENMVWRFWEEKRHYGNLFVSGLFLKLDLVYCLSVEYLIVVLKMLRREKLFENPKKSYSRKNSILFQYDNLPK